MGWWLSLVRKMMQKDKWLPWCADTKQEWGTPTTNQSRVSCLWQQTSEVKGAQATVEFQRWMMKQDNTLTSNISHVLLSVVGMTDMPHWKLFIWDILCVTFLNLIAALKKINERKGRGTDLFPLLKSFHRSLPWTAKPRKCRDQCSLSFDEHILSDLSSSPVPVKVMWHQCLAPHSHSNSS